MFTHLPEAPFAEYSVLPESVFGYRLSGKKARTRHWSHGVKMQTRFEPDTAAVAAARVSSGGPGNPSCDPTLKELLRGWCSNPRPARREEQRLAEREPKLLAALSVSFPPAPK